MVANKAYAYDLSVPNIKEDNMPDKKDFKILKSPAGKRIAENIKSTANKVQTNSKLSLVISTALIFTMLILVSYRYNLISEKNLQLQRLKIEQTEVNSELATTEVLLEKVIDKDKVEAYAKQQLGMQKPQKSQIVYINSDYETKVEEVVSKNIFEKGLDKLKNLIGM